MSAILDLAEHVTLFDLWTHFDLKTKIRGRRLVLKSLKMSMHVIYVQFTRFVHFDSVPGPMITLVFIYFRPFFSISLIFINMQMSNFNQNYFGRKANVLAQIWHKFNLVITKTVGDIKKCVCNGQHCQTCTPVWPLTSLWPSKDTWRATTGAESSKNARPCML